MKNLLFAFFALSLLISCKNNETPQPEKPIEEPEMPAITLSDFPNSVEFADAKMEAMAYKNGKFSFKYSGTGYTLGEQTPDAEQLMCANSGQGQHIHLIVDNEPYAAKYEADFEHEVADGDHHILAFLSRSYHQSIKNGQAAIAQKVNVQKGSINKSEPIAGPMLFYSRPKGTYTGKKETDKVMLDYYMVNEDQCEGCGVKVEIDGHDLGVLKGKSPKYIEGLGMGEHTVKLTLIGADGAAVQTPLNPVERTFTCAADPAEGQ